MSIWTESSHGTGLRGTRVRIDGSDGGSLVVQLTSATGDVCVTATPNEYGDVMVNPSDLVLALDIAGVTTRHVEQLHQLNGASS